jgi:hypothetical protein
MTTAFDQLADRILASANAPEADAATVLRADDSQLMHLVAAAGRLRRKHLGNTIKVNYLGNLKSGLCPENCNYCSQALGSQAPILKYSWLSTGGRPWNRQAQVCVVAQAASAWSRLAVGPLIVTSTRSPR